MTLPRIPFIDLRRGAAGSALDAELEEAFRRVLRSGQYILGAEVAAFERACAETIGVKHAIGVSSGTDALLVALMALGVGPGDEVVCSTYSFVATASVVARVGATPVFADCAPRGFNVDVDDMLRKITPRTRALLPVHLFGVCAEMDPLVAAARARGIAVVEDAAQALGATYRGRAAGALGTVGCFSFFPTKNLGAVGDAGLVTTDDDALAARLRALRVQGAAPGRRYEHIAIGGNFRMDELQAALLRVKLAHLAEATRARRANIARYREAIGDDTPNLAFPDALDEGATAHQLVLRIARGRDEVRAELAAAGVDTAIYYPVPLHRQPCFASPSGAPPSLPNAEALAREALAVPIFPGMTEGEIDRVASALLHATRRHAAHP